MSPIRPSLRSTGVVIAALFVCISRVSGQPSESFDLGIGLESRLVPDLDATSTITGAIGDTVPFTIDLVLGTTASHDNGIQGWSLGMWTAGFEIDEVSFDGTISALTPLGGAVDPEAGFRAFRVIDPELNKGRSGIIQAVAFGLPALYPPPRHRYTIGRVFCSATIEAKGRIGFARYEEGLAANSQPVSIVVTVAGQSKDVSRSERNITIGFDATPEDCDDGIDNDGDGWMDTEDPECVAPLPREICDDGEDNDGDGNVDCRDSQCAFALPCPAVETCDDGIDNDRDGDADCDDDDCDGHPFCLARELCDDGVDNDNDGLVDCEDRDCSGLSGCPVIEFCADGRDDDDDGDVDCQDSDCFRSRFCASFEFCADGEDNNGDGLADCDDPQCSRGPACVTTETCDDGIDNDDDGDIDCDDTQCLGAGDCPGPERCRDGLDNDRDGDVDCDDDDCLRDRFCIDPEICDDGIDNDGDRDIDCDDTQCLGRGGCPGPEICDDGIDNNQDGDADCDDSECAAIARCRRAEDCDNGVDDDIDGLVDCDDPDCAGREDCRLELCDNGIDDDGDGLADCDDLACSHRSPCGGGESGFELVLFASGATRESREAEGGGAGEETLPRVPTNVVVVDPTTSNRVEVVTYVVPFPAPQTTGIQGWSLSIKHDSELMRIVGAPSIEGTDGGEFFTGGFEKTETTGGDGSGAGGDDGAGVVSSVVLSFGSPSGLDPTMAQSILRTKYELDLVGGKRPAIVRFRDGLRGSGQPVSNILTLDGRSESPVRLIPIEFRIESGSFVRGDVNSDGKVDLADAIWALSDLMRGGPPAPCLAAADVNGDGSYDVADAVYVIQYRFLHGPSIPAPFPACGKDPDPEGLPCPTGAAPRCRA